MNADQQTLRELGIIGTAQPRDSIYERFKATRTVGGEQRLKQRFRSPLSHIDEIRRTQAAITYLQEHGARFERVLDGSRWHAVESYCGSAPHWPHHSGALAARVDAWRIRWQHGPILEQLRLGIASLQYLGREAAQLVEALEGYPAPAVLREVLENLASVLAHPALERLVSSRDVYRWSTSALLAVDWHLRDDRFSAVRHFARQVYEIDALRSMALATRRHRLVLPEFVDAADPTIEVEDMVHPLVRDPRPNDVRLRAGSRLQFITGPNMAGKSTYLKSVGILVYLAHLGMGVPAKRAVMTPFDRIFSGIDVSDDVGAGESYYLREVRRVQEIARNLSGGERALVIFDEMFRGTNLMDAADGVTLVAQGFVRFSQGAFLISSHIVEVAQAVQTLPGVSLLHFRGDIDGDDVRFDFRLHPGVSDQRLGLFILQREGVLGYLGVDSRS